MLHLLPAWAHRRRTLILALLLAILPSTGPALVESSGEARMLERWLAVERAALARESVPVAARSAPMFSDTPDFVAWTTHRPTLWLTREEYQRLYAHSPRGGRSDLPPPPRPDELWFHEDPHGPERSPGGPPR